MNGSVIRSRRSVSLHLVIKAVFEQEVQILDKHDQPPASRAGDIFQTGDRQLLALLIVASASTLSSQLFTGASRQRQVPGGSPPGNPARRAR